MTSGCPGSERSTRGCFASIEAMAQAGSRASPHERARGNLCALERAGFPAERCAHPKATSIFEEQPVLGHRVRRAGATAAPRTRGRDPRRAARTAARESRQRPSRGRSLASPLVRRRAARGDRSGARAPRGCAVPSGPPRAGRVSPRVRRGRGPRRLSRPRACVRAPRGVRSPKPRSVYRPHVRSPTRSGSTPCGRSREATAREVADATAGPGLGAFERGAPAQ